MEAIAAPLQTLVEQASWFVRAREVRLLHVVASTDLRQPALSVVMGQEFHADNRSPFVRLEGLVVVLAPAQVEKPRELEADLGQLLHASALADVRWIVVDVEPGLEALLEERSVRLEPAEGEG